MHQNVTIHLIFSGFSICNEDANAVLVNLPVGLCGETWTPSRFQSCVGSPAHNETVLPLGHRIAWVFSMTFVVTSMYCYLLTEHHCSVNIGRW